jgi:prophage antirepressor-like protein
MGSAIQVFTKEFDEGTVTLTAIEYSGQRVWIAKQVGRALGYKRDGAQLITSMNQWKAEFVEGVDYIKLSGGELREFYQAFGGHRELRLPPYGGRLLFLTEEGLNLVLIKTDKPIGKKTRRWLKSEVLPAIRKTGTYSIADRMSELQIRALEDDILLKRNRAAYDIAERAYTKGILGEKYMTAFTKDCLSIAQGTKLVLSSDEKIIDVTTFLRGKGLPIKVIEKVRSQFGTRLCLLYKRTHGKDPEVGTRQINGAWVDGVKMYVETDRPLFEQVWNSASVQATIKRAEQKVKLLKGKLRASRKP